MRIRDASICDDRGTDTALLTQLLGRLENKAIVAVGAGESGFLGSLVEAGAEAVYVFEPLPASVEIVRSTFGDMPTVRVFDIALGARDEAVMLHVAEDETGHHGGAFHSLVPFDETSALRIVGEIPVRCRRLDSLLAEGAIPSQIGILKVDTARSGLAVLQGMGSLHSDVVVVEYWDDLPEPPGPSADQVSDVADFMAKRGYAHYALIGRHDQFETLQIDSPQTRPGDWGSLVFVHDSLFPVLAAVIYEAASAAQARLVDQARSFADEANKRSSMLKDVLWESKSRQILADEARQEAEELRREAANRLATIENLERAVILSRFEVLEDQEAALEAYIRICPDDRLWKWVAPQLGVLHQHPPMPFHVPEHYLKTAQLFSTSTISIVTPTLNGAQFLLYTIESVLAQEYPSVEYIIQDGGSTDETLGILDAYKDKLAHVASEKDDGMAQAINRGFAHASGAIMAYLNSDDVLLPGTLQYVAAYFETHPDVDVVYGHRVLIDEHNAEIGRWVLPPHDDAMLSWADYVPQETMFWRRSVWDRAGGEMDESFRFALDWDLLLRFRDLGARFKRLPRFLAAFRVHAVQKTSVELGDVGAGEMARLRKRAAGRPLSHGEAEWYLDGFMRRHKVYHKLYRIGALRY